MSEADKKRKARKKAIAKAHVDGVKATGEALPANMPGTTISASNTTDTDPIEVPLEAESVEETEAVEDAVKEAVEAEIEAAVPEEREPEETPVEAEPKPSVAEMKAEAEKIIEDSDIPEAVKKDITVEIVDEAGVPLEAKSEPSTISIEEARAAAAEVEVARLEKLAEVARLQARLRELGVK